MTTDSHPAWLSVKGEAIWLRLKVQPRASKNELGPPLGDQLKVRVTAPPVDSAANEAVLELITDVLDCSKSQVQLQQGHTARNKVVSVHGFSATEVLARFQAVLIKP